MSYYDIAVADHATRVLLREEAKRVAAVYPVATDEEIGRLVFGLLIMYESFERRGEEAKVMVVDQWKQSLQGWPLSDLKSGISNWINGQKASFVPQPGDILTYCRRHEYSETAMARKAMFVLASKRGLEDEPEDPFD